MKKNDQRDKINIHAFPNGFRVIHQKPTSDLPISSIHTFCNVGSAFETDTVRGISHFIEHLCFKGTKKIVDTRRDIFMMYDTYGAEFNAYTEKHVTCYTMKCPDHFVNRSLQIVGDMLTHSTIPQIQFDREQKVVVEENIKNENNPDITLSDKTNSVFFNGSSYQYPVDSIKFHQKEDTLKRKDAIEWYQYFYQPKNFTMSVVSNISFEKIKEFLQTTDFTKMNPSLPPPLPKTALAYPNTAILPNKTPGVQYLRIPKKGIQTNMIEIGFRICNGLSNDRYIFKVVKAVLNGRSGRLVVLLRETHGLVYSSSSDTEYYENAGSFSISTETDPNKLIRFQGKKGVLPLIFELYADLIKHGITQEELTVAKGYLKGSILMSLEDSENLCNYNGEKMIIGGDTREIVPYSQIYERFIDKITRKDVNDCIRRYFVPENMVVGILGETLPSEQQLKKCVMQVFTHSESV